MPLYSITATASLQAETSTTANALTSNVLVASTIKLIAPANSNRKQLTIFNKENLTVYFGYSNTVSATNYAFKLTQDGYFELPNPIYTGDVYAFCPAANTLAVTEFV